MMSQNCPACNTPVDGGGEFHPSCQEEVNRGLDEYHRGKHADAIRALIGEKINHVKTVLGLLATVAQDAMRAAGNGYVYRADEIARLSFQVTQIQGAIWALRESIDEV